MDFTEKLRLHGKAEEDLFFAEVDRQLIEAMHKQQEAEGATLHQGEFEQAYYRIKRHCRENR